MKTSPNAKGYLRVNLTPPTGRYRTLKVHRLVLEAFVGPCPEGGECRHLNGVKTDCRLKNLAWGTPEQNRQDNRDMGMYAAGEEHNQAKLTEDDVRAIRARRAAGDSLRVLAARYDVAESNISAIATRRSWKHVD